MKLSKAQVAALRGMAVHGPVNHYQGGANSKVGWLSRPLFTRDNLRRPSPTTLTILANAGYVSRKSNNLYNTHYTINDAGRAYLAALDKEQLS